MALTLAIPHTYAVQGLLAVASGATNFLPNFFVPVPPGQTCALVAVRAMIRNASDSVTLKIQQNGADITGMTGISVTNSPATTTLASFIDVFDDDHFGVIITALGTAPDGLSLTFYFNYQVEE